MAGYFVCYGTIRLDDKWAWKIPTLIQGGLAMIMAVLVIVSVHQEHWLNLVTTSTSFA